MKQQLLDAWTTHNSKNMLLLQHLHPQALELTTGPRSRTIAAQLAHVHNTRINWLEHVAKQLHDTKLLFPTDAKPDAIALQEAFNTSSEKITGLIDHAWSHDGKIPYFKKGLLPFIAYLIAHESHHRGAIFLLLKQNNFKLPDNVKWGMWEWN